MNAASGAEGSSARAPARSARLSIRASAVTNTTRSRSKRSGCAPGASSGSVANRPWPSAQGPSTTTDVPSGQREGAAESIASTRRPSAGAPLVLNATAIALIEVPSAEHGVRMIHDTRAMNGALTNWTPIDVASAALDTIGRAALIGSVLAIAHARPDIGVAASPARYRRDHRARHARRAGAARAPPRGVP